MIEKWILREASKPFITKELYERKKHPYLAPPKWEVGGPLHQMLGKMLTKEKVENLGFVDYNVVKRCYEAGFGVKADTTSFRTLLVVAGWVAIGEKFGIPRARPDPPTPVWF
jgi:asparagine synthase (glutamine-hydrolysing)